jgi:phosphate starvation-inducible PhoH-like protein
VEINHRGNAFHAFGEPEAVESTGRILWELYRETEGGATLTPERVHLMLQQSQAEVRPQGSAEQAEPAEEEVVLRTRRGPIKPRGANQHRYVRNILTHDINFGVGPAGTGKTYLAVACAVDALERELVRRLVLVRPAVEAGERLGFLPGDLAQKIDPYLRPLYDALYELLGFERVGRLLERSVIELAPLAYMRGRTLNESFIILDEAQNTTTEQMMMFLTRMGFGSTIVVTGDITQIDLPKGKQSGLRHALEVLEAVEGVTFTLFRSKDVVRHPLVQRIVEAYAQHSAAAE